MTLGPGGFGFLVWFLRFFCRSVAVGGGRAPPAFPKPGGCRSIPKGGQGKRALSHQRLHLVPLWGHESPDGAVKHPQILDRVPGVPSAGARCPRWQHRGCPRIPEAERRFRVGRRVSCLASLKSICVFEPDSSLSLFWLYLFGIDRILKGKADKPD